MKELFIFAYIHFQSLKANWALHFFACHNQKKTICEFVLL